MTLSRIFDHLYQQLRSGAWLNQNRVHAYLRIAFILQSIAFVYLVLTAYNIIHSKNAATSTDFLSFYAAGYLSEHGTPDLAYNLTAHTHAERVVSPPDGPYFSFFYPPVYLLVCDLLAHAPYLVAFGGFVGITLILYLWVLYPLLPKQVFPIAALASPTVILAIGSGQNSFLTAGLVGGAMLLLYKKPYLAGLLLGGLCYKPHFGLLLPIALLVGGEWKALLGAITSVLSLVALSIWMFGLKTWQAYRTIQELSFHTFENGWVLYSQQASIFGGLRNLGANTSIAYGFQILIALLVAIMVGLVWYKSKDMPARATVLTIGSTLVPPVFLNYDLVLAGVGMAWLISAATVNGYRPWEKTTLLLSYVVTAFSAWSGQVFHFNLSAWVMLTLFFLAFRRARCIWTEDYLSESYKQEIAVI